MTHYSTQGSKREMGSNLDAILEILGRSVFELDTKALGRIRCNATEAIMPNNIGECINSDDLDGPIFVRRMLVRSAQRVRGEQESDDVAETASLLSESDIQRLTDTEIETCAQNILAHNNSLFEGYTDGSLPVKADGERESDYLLQIVRGYMREQATRSEKLFHAFSKNVKVSKSRTLLKRHFLLSERLNSTLRDYELTIPASTVLESIRQQKLHINKFQNELRRAYERFQQIVRDLPKRRQEEREALENFAELGWYPDPAMPWDFPTTIAKFESNDVDVEEAISDYFRQRANAIEEELESSYPRRNDILCDAFQAHREKKFNLSIPVFLAQADGMWRDKFDDSVFTGKGRAHVARLPDSPIADWLTIFRSSIPLWESESRRDSSFSGFNRHQILHGEIVNYGTEVNSLKAISFLSCLCWILKEDNGTIC